MFVTTAALSDEPPVSPYAAVVLCVSVASTTDAFPVRPHSEPARDTPTAFRCLTRRETKVHAGLFPLPARVCRGGANVLRLQAHAASAERAAATSSGCALARRAGTVSLPVG